ncbi:MAG: hypothetical protein P8L77_04980 [Gammaproteobacteria bacterium]|nr:hypothetical protein [Gammaproteobacteria bacterium]
MNKYIGLSLTYGASALTSVGLTVGGLADTGSMLITASTAICAITGLGFGIQDFRASLKARDASSASVNKDLTHDLEAGPPSLTSANLTANDKKDSKQRPETPSTSTSTESLSNDSTPNKDDNDPTLNK